MERSSAHSLTATSRWIFSTAITPQTDKEWVAWRESLDPAYDHESVIGQPAKFAEALGRMVTEQLGAQGTDGWMQGSFGKGEVLKTNHPTQWILHGPVIYTDRLYDSLMRDLDEEARLLAPVFHQERNPRGATGVSIRDPPWEYPPKRRCSSPFRG